MQTLENYRGWLDSELLAVRAALEAVPAQKWRELATYTLRMRETDLLSARAVLELFEFDAGRSGSI